MSPKGIAPADRNTPMRTARRIASLALAAATALTATACGQAETGTITTRSGYSVANDDVPVSVCPAEDEARLAGDEGLLIGAHFALRVECVVSFTELPEGFELEYLFGEETLYAPQDGLEFTVVQFAPDPAVEAPFALGIDPPQLTATLAIGEQTWDFEGEVPAPGSTYAAVVEAGAPVTLEVVDTERTQTMDLRERTREGLIQALYNGSTDVVNTDVVDGSVDGYLSTGSYEYWFDDWIYQTQFTVSRESFTPEEGWVAEPDRARLSIEFGWLQSGSGLEWSIDLDTALVVSGPDGALTAATSDHADQDIDGGVWRTYHLTYDVPASALEFTIKFHPEGPVDWPEEGISMPITGDQEHEIPVSFA